MQVSERKKALQDNVLAAAETIIAAHGLNALKARDVAQADGCSLGAIYTVFSDLDDLILAVNLRTLGRLQTHLSAYPTPHEETAQANITWLVALSAIYLDFAATNRLLWRALFEHHIPPGKEPSQTTERHRALFAFIEKPLEHLAIEPDAAARTLLARSLFSAVHGMVALGLEEKLTRMSLETLRQQIEIIVSASVAGLLGAGQRERR